MQQNNCQNIYLQGCKLNIIPQDFRGDKTRTIMALSITNNLSLENYSLDADNTSTITAPYDYTRYHIAEWLDKYAIYILTAIALLFNSVSLFTICKMRPRTSTSIYIATLAVVDTLCLIFKLLTVELVRYPSVPEVISCGLLLSLFLFVQYAASWLIVIISVERFLAVWFPLKVSLVSTKRMAVIILSILFVTLIPLSVWTFWFYYRVIHEKWGVLCITRRRYDSAMEVIERLHPVIYIVLPFLLILIFNLLIILGLRRARSLRHQVHANGSMNKKNVRSRPVKLTLMLLITAIVFLILEAMMLIRTLFKNYSPKDGNRSFVNDFFFVEIAQTLEDTNHAINFFLYFCSGAKFRETLFSFCRKRTHPRQLTWSSRMSSYKVSHHRSNSHVGESAQLAETPQ